MTDRYVEGWDRCREACAAAIRAEQGDPRWVPDTRYGIGMARRVVEALPTPKPTPDPRDAEIAKLQAALREIANAALARCAP